MAIDGYDPVYGARPLKRLIQREVVDRIAEKVITGELHDRSHVLIDISGDGDYECRIEANMNLDDADFDSLLSGEPHEGQGPHGHDLLEDLDTLSNGDLGEDPIA